jgi:hypothetical protein
MEHQFDLLAKALAEGVSRREALRRITGGLAGALLASMGLGKSWGSGVSCSDRRLSLCTSAVSTSAARARAICRTQRCINAVNEGEARALAGCRKEFGCPAGQTCVNSTCSTACPQGEMFCNGACISVVGNLDHCGECGFVCRSDAQTTRACCGYKCFDTSNDRYNCGGCGYQSSSYICRTDQICSNGQCQCATGKADCNGTCVDTSSDPNNCGNCAGAGGAVCTHEGTVCSAGTCACDQGWVSCGPGCCPGVAQGGVPFWDCQPTDTCFSGSGYVCRYGQDGTYGDRCVVL